MGPVDMSGLAQYLGPLTGGGFMGEQQRAAMQESDINQQKGLEDILTQQQTRDIARQKLPGELDMQQQNILAKKGEVAKQGTDAIDRERKLKKEDYADFLDGITKMSPNSVAVTDRAEYMNDLSKRTGIPVDHPMYKIALQAYAGGPKVWEEFVKGFKVSPETRYKEEQVTARQEIQTAGQIEGQRIGADSRTEVARVRTEQAQAKAAQVKQSTDQLIAKLTEEHRAEQNPQRKAEIAQYIAFLRRGQIAVAPAAGSGKTDELERTLQMFQDATMKAPPPKALPTAPQAPGAQPQAAPQAAPAAAPQAAAPQAAPVPPGQVRVKGPDGRIGFIPQNQLQEALSSGYTQL